MPPAKIIYVSPAIDPNLARERLAIVRQLKELGFNVIVPYNPVIGKELAEFAQAAKSMGAKPLLVPTNHPIAHQWIRDHMTYGGKKRIVNREATELQSAAARNRSESDPLSEGGNIVQAGPKKYFINQVALGHAQQVLQQTEGVTFIPISTENRSQKTANQQLLRRGEKANPAPHLDMMFNVIPKKRIAVITETGLELNPGLSAQLKKEGMKVVVIPRFEEPFFPANFIHLGPNEILMNQAAPFTLKSLRRLGVNVIPSAIPIIANLREEGSLRCFTQLSRGMNRMVFGEKPKPNKPAIKRVMVRPKIKPVQKRTRIRL